MSPWRVAEEGSGLAGLSGAEALAGLRRATAPTAGFFVAGVAVMLTMEADGG